MKIMADKNEWGSNMSFHCNVWFCCDLKTFGDILTYSILTVGEHSTSLHRSYFTDGNSFLTISYIILFFHC